MLCVCILANAFQWETISAPVTLIEVTVTYNPYRMKDIFYIYTTDVQTNGPDLTGSFVPPFHLEKYQTLNGCCDLENKVKVIWVICDKSSFLGSSLSITKSIPPYEPSEI